MDPGKEEPVAFSSTSTSSDTKAREDDDEGVPSVKQQDKKTSNLLKKEEEESTNRPTAAKKMPPVVPKSETIQQDWPQSPVSKDTQPQHTSANDKAENDVVPDVKSSTTRNTDTEMVSPKSMGGKNSENNKAANVKETKSKDGTTMNPPSQKTKDRMFQEDKLLRLQQKIKQDSSKSDGNAGTAPTHDEDNSETTIPSTMATPSETIVHDQYDFLTHSTLAGSIKPVLKKFLISREQMKRIVSGICETAEWSDITLLIFLGWLVIPILEFPYKEKLRKQQQHGADDSTTSLESLLITNPFRKTKRFLIIDHISQIAKISLAVYVVDLIKIILEVLGFHFYRMRDWSHSFAIVAYSTWMMNRLVILKRHVLASVTNVSAKKRHKRQQDPNNLEGRCQIVDRLMDAVIYAVGYFLILDMCKIHFEQAGATKGMFFTLGGTTTLIMTFASQGIISQIFNGLLLSASERMYEGDSVQIGDSLKGKVEDLGWMETVIRCSDDIAVTVPNSYICNQKISNLSRVNTSQVQQTLRFQYKDVDKLPTIMEDIKKEIMISCPKLITDGSRPFRVIWSNYADDHLEVTVNSHFNISPTSGEYHTNRQSVLQAINRAVKRNHVRFAVHHHDEDDFRLLLKELVRSQAVRATSMPSMSSSMSKTGSSSMGSTSSSSGSGSSMPYQPTQ